MRQCGMIRLLLRLGELRCNLIPNPFPEGRGTIALVIGGPANPKLCGFGDF